MRDVDPRITRREARRRQIRRRRLTALAGVAVALAFASGLAVAWAGQGPDSDAAGFAISETEPQEGTRSQAVSAVRPGKPSSRTTLVLRETLGGEISPKSVVSSGTGLIFAQNMMYRHSVTVYDAKSLELRKTISDSVNLADFGYKGYPETNQGAPVEAAFSPDGAYAYSPATAPTDTPVSARDPIVHQTRCMLAPSASRTPASRARSSTIRPVTP